MFRCRAFNFFDFYAIQTFDVLKRRRLKFMSGWNILKIVSLGGLCPWVAVTLGLEYFPKNELLISLRHLLTFSSEKTQIVGLGDFILWEAATPVFLWLGIPVQNINFLFDDLTNQMRRDTWKKKWKQTVIVPVFLLFLAHNVFLVSTT